MTYSFTEKKRIRKSFAKRAAVLDVPFLLATQINSYAEFLQSEVAGDSRREMGLQSAFTSNGGSPSAKLTNSSRAFLEWLSIGKIEVNAACSPSFLRRSGATDACRNAA